jgi:hypothetical protein
MNHLINRENRADELARLVLWSGGFEYLWVDDYLSL